MKNTIGFALGCVFALVSCSETDETPSVRNKSNEMSLKPRPAKDHTRLALIDSETSEEVWYNESFGTLKFGLDAPALTQILGAPDEITEEILWGADGGFHSEWVYKKKGLRIGMCYVPDHSDSTFHTNQVDRITMYSNCELKTKQGIGIGSSLEDVKGAYGSTGQMESLMDGWFVVGSVYGGLMFRMEDDSVAEIFLGAMAE